MCLSILQWVHQQPLMIMYYFKSVAKCWSTLITHVINEYFASWGLRYITSRFKENPMKKFRPYASFSLDEDQMKINFLIGLRTIFLLIKIRCRSIISNVYTPFSLDEDQMKIIFLIYVGPFFCWWRSAEDQFLMYATNTASDFDKLS